MKNVWNKRPINVTHNTHKQAIWCVSIQIGKHALRRVKWIGLEYIHAWKDSMGKLANFLLITMITHTM